MSLIELDPELLKTWPDFCKFARDKIKSGEEPKSSSLSEDTSSLDSSVLLTIMNRHRLDLYEECGFGSDVVKNLDGLIHKVEEFCLLNVVKLYDAFKLQSQVKQMSSCTVDLKRIDSVLEKRVGQRSSRKRVIPFSKILRYEYNNDRVKKEPQDSSDSGELGRGKRKKFSKIMFGDSTEDSPRSFNKGTPQIVSGNSKNIDRTPVIRKSSHPKTKVTPPKSVRKDSPQLKETVENAKMEAEQDQEIDTSDSKNKRLAEKKRVSTPIVHALDQNISLEGSKKESDIMDLEMSVDVTREPTDEGKYKLSLSKDDIDGDAKKDKNEVYTYLHVPQSASNIMNSQEVQSKEKDVLPLQTNATSAVVNNLVKNDSSLIDESCQTDQCTAGGLETVDKEKLVKSEPVQGGLVENAPEIEKENTGDGKDDANEEENIFQDGRGRRVKQRVSKRGRGPQKLPKKFPWNLVPIVCSLCKTRYSTYSTLRRHWTKSHAPGKCFDRANPPNLLLCQVCDETFSSPRAFLRHYRSHAAEQDINFEKFELVKFVGERSDFACDKLAPITCSICKAVMVGDGFIYNHWKKEHKTEDQTKPPPLFYCDVCEQCFDAPRKFKLHYRMHTGAKPHVCQKCFKSFRTFSDLNCHMLSHNQKREYLCTICNKGFISQKILNKHMKGHLSPCICDICGKSYPSKYSLGLHTKIHTGEKPHKCEFCGVSFTQAGSLKLHRRLHLGEKPHVCETCGMRFNSLSHLRTHRRVHTGEKPYKCDKCSYAAASSSRLKDHATTHKDEKPHVCKVPGCGRRYKRLSHLIFHHSKHAGVKPYVCKTCGMAFKLSSALTLHKRQDACALHLERNQNQIVKEEWSEEQSQENEPSITLLMGEPGGTNDIDAPKEEQHSVLIYQDVKEDFEESEGIPQQITIVNEASQDGAQNDSQEGYEQQIVIQIVREPGHEDEDFVLSKEELERIVRLSQQM